MKMSKIEISEDVEEIESLDHCEELLRLRTRQLFVLMTISQEIVKETNLHKQLIALANGIVDAKLYRRALISLFGSNWKRIDVGYAGFSKESIRALKKNKPLSPAMWKKTLTAQYLVSESYYIPEKDPFNRELGGILSDSSVKDFDGWHPNDYLFVPLRSHTGKIIGIISVDDPLDGKKPSARSETLRLLELFAHEAAELIDRNKLLKRIHEQQVYLKQLIHSSADIIISADRYGRIKVFNPAAERCFGYKSQRVQGKSVLELYKDSGQVKELMREMRRNKGLVENEEIEIISKSGETIPISLSASILYDRRGKEIGTVGVSRDLRPLKELQEKLVEAEKRAAVQKTVVTLAHHIRNQLMAQVALLTHLRQDIEVIEDKKLQKEFCDALTKALDRSFQIAHITRTLQNPPEELKEEKYIGTLEMLALPTCTIEKPREITGLKIKSLKILVADDHPVLRDGFAEFLKHFKMNVDTAGDGGEAIELIKATDYDLVISDIKMPKATGFDVFKAAKDKNPDTKVILMTAFGYDPDHTIVKAAREGLKGVFFKEKPFDLTRLLEAIAKLFDPSTGPGSE